MGLPFPTIDSLEVSRQALNLDAQYAAAAWNWEEEVAFVVEADDEGAVAPAHLDLWHGRCRSATSCSGVKGVPKAKFELRGSLQKCLCVARSIPTQGTAQQLLTEEHGRASREQCVGPAGSV